MHCFKILQSRRQFKPLHIFLKCIETERGNNCLLNKQTKGKVHRYLSAVHIFICFLLKKINVGICSPLGRGANLMDQPSTGSALKPQPLGCSSSSFPGGRDDVPLLALYRHGTILSSLPRGNHRALPVWVQTGADFTFAPVSLCWPCHPSLSSSDNAQNRAPALNCPVMLVRALVPLSEIIKLGDSMGGQLHLDVGCSWETGHEECSLFSKDTAIGSGGDRCCPKWGRASHHTCGIHLMIWASLGLILPSPMGPVKNSPFKFRRAALVAGLAYSTRAQTHVRLARRGRFFLIAACGFFGPRFVGTLDYRCNLSHLYVFLTDRYIG